MKIAVYAIAKNEAKFVNRFMAAAADADCIIVADTGSTDDTRGLLSVAEAGLRSISIQPFRFDDARNAALALVPADVDVCFAMDLDEVMQPGWREEIERLWVPGETTYMRYLFDWGDGIQFYSDKIHARHGYRWHHPCHEALRADRIEEKFVSTDKLLVVHKPDPAKSRGQYLELLRLATKEDPNCPRNAFYFSRELGFAGLWDECIEQSKRYLALPEAKWLQERAWAMRNLSRCYQAKEDAARALHWARRAVAEYSEQREGWCDLSLLCYKLGTWEECLGAALSALRITEKELVHTTDPKCWGPMPHDLASIAAWNLGYREAAIRHGTDALALAPADPRLKGNVDLMISDRKPADASR